ncbi:hypothetical protein L9F63_026654, partial [Diploptera punctata]
GPPSTTLELPLFTCLMDMVALEQGLFCDNRDPRRLRLAQNNLLHGLRLSDGSIFKYSNVNGPTVTMDTNQCLKAIEQNEKPSENA